MAVVGPVDKAGRHGQTIDGTSLLDITRQQDTGYVIVIFLTA